MNRLKIIIQILLVFALSFQALSTYGQAPLIKSLDKRYGAPLQTVSIIGLNFGADPSKLAVYFGGVRGNITSASDQLIEAQTPVGTTFDKIKVFNTSTGLGAESRGSFFLDFGGSNPINAANLKPQVDFASGAGLYDHCLCDFDGDSKLDVATANTGANSISFYKNTSVVGTFSFTGFTASVGSVTIHSTCGDLNGDGKPDLVVSEGNSGTHIYVFKNSGTLPLTMTGVIALSGKQVKRLEIADLDRDGKPELIVTDQGASSDVIILPNQSTTASIIFGPPVVVPITVKGFKSTDGIIVEDINGDFRPEIILSQFLSTKGNLSILHNQSSAGNFDFSDQDSLIVSGPMVNLKLGDLDGDHLPDIVATQLLGSSISVFLNKSGTSIQFATPHTIPTVGHPWGLDFGDLDGDSKLDIVVTSVTDKSLSVLNNNSTAGNLSFNPILLPTNYITRHVKIADMDGDAKPDIVFTSVDDNVNGIPASKVSIIRNASCMTPQVSPGGPLTICSGFPLTLNATVSGGTTYQWYNNNALMPGETNSYLNPLITGQYSVTAVSESGACSQSSNTVNITVMGGAALGTVSPTNNGPVCLTGTLQLSVADVGATLYSWRGPENYSGTGLMPAAISNFGEANAGRYYLDVYSGTCLAQQSSTVVQVVAFPQFRVSAPSAGLLCQGQSETITLAPNSSNVSYQWYEQITGVIPGETNPSLVVSTAGNYFGKVTSTLYGACPSAISDTVTIKVVSLPSVNFSAPSTACVGQLITFANSSSTDSQATPIYSWTFGDGNTSSDQSPTYTYSSTNTYTVQLKVSYTGGICSQIKSQSITVTSAPPLTIISNSGLFSFCEGSFVTLKVSGSGFDPSSYLWSTAATTDSIQVNSAGTYTVSAKTTVSGCLITASKDISMLPRPSITISATPTTIDEGKTSQLDASGLTNYVWRPGKTLSDSTVANPVATPFATTLYKVSGVGDNGCIGIDSVLVTVKGASIAGKLKPKNLISPGNGDPINEKWEIENIQDYPQCGVAIYDEKGIKVFEAKPYNNDWGGTFNGQLLPIGAYYYIIRCDGDGSPKTGSITIIR